MSFDNSVNSYIHLVSCPSVWLPDPGTCRIMLLGVSPQMLDQVVSDLQVNHTERNWAIYHNLEFDFSNVNHMDWLLINASHLDGCWTNVVDTDHLSMSLALKSIVRGVNSVDIREDQPESVSHLADISGLNFQNLEQFLNQVAQRKSGVCQR